MGIATAEEVMKHFSVSEAERKAYRKAHDEREAEEKEKYAQQFFRRQGDGQLAVGACNHRGSCSQTALIPARIS